MDLINKQVKHTKFGIGNVVSCTDSVVQVHFTVGNKKFVFPDAFETYLMLLDKDTANAVNELIEKNEIEHLKEELELELERSQHEKEQRCLMEWEKQMKKLHPSSQVAFWCKAEEKDRVFKEWKVFLGVKKSGTKQGQPNKPLRMHQNSVCLLTEREPQNPEKERCVTGVYLVNETFIGKYCEDGYVPAHSKYRIRLSEEEAGKLLFWNYYVNERFPHKMTWNTGTYRYIENVCVAQILRDIVAMRKDSEHGELVQNFYNYFCQMNQILESELPEPKGALKL